MTNTRAEVVTWTEVELTRAKGRVFNEQILWLDRQQLIATVDYLYLPGGKTRSQEARSDIFKFKTSSMATLFKLTFGGS